MRGMGVSLVVLSVFAPAVGQAQDLKMLGDLGFRAGAGVDLALSDEDTGGADLDDLALPLAFGLAWQLDLEVATFEADLLYRQDPLTVASRNAQLTAHRVSLPLLLKVAVPGLEALRAGSGIEPRLLLAADEESAGSAEDVLESLTWYVPTSLGAALDVGGFTLDLEGRFEFQLSNHYEGPQADAARAHQLMFYVGGFF